MSEAHEHNTPENMDALYSDINYVFSYVGRGGRLEWYEQAVDSFIELTAIDLTSKRVADAGCATGHALRHVYTAYHPAEAWGFDYSKEALKWARKILPEGKFRFHHLEKPLKEKFDLIISFEVFEHLYNPELVLKNLLDALEDGGMLFLTVPDADQWRWGLHINHWTLDEFEAFCGAKHIGRLGDTLLAVVVKE